MNIYFDAWYRAQPIDTMAPFGPHGRMALERAFDGGCCLAQTVIRSHAIERDGALRDLAQALVYLRTEGHGDAKHDVCGACDLVARRDDFLRGLADEFEAAGIAAIAQARGES